MSRSRGRGRGRDEDRGRGMGENSGNAPFPHEPRANLGARGVHWRTQAHTPRQKESVHDMHRTVGLAA
jgi:hypothetical protein